MASFSDLRTATKEYSSIKDANTTFDTEINRWINDGQQDFANETNWKYLEARFTDASTTYKFKYTLPSNTDVVKSVIWEHDHYMRPVNADQWVRLNLHQSIGTPRYYIIKDGSLHINPQPDKSAYSNVLSNGCTSGETSSLTMTSVSGFEEKGRIKIDSEVIEYAYVDASNNKLGQLNRGIEGTTATTHATSARATYRNIEYDVFKTLADMSGDSDVSGIPARYHRALPIYAAAQYFYKIEERPQGDNFMIRYRDIRSQAKRDLGERQAQKFTSVLDDTPIEYPGYYDNTYPDRGSLSQN